MSSVDRLTVVLVQVLEAAQAGGMSETEAKKIYTSITNCYENFNGDFPDAMVEEIRKIVNQDFAVC